MLVDENMSSIFLVICPFWQVKDLNFMENRNILIFFYKVHDLSKRRKLKDIFATDQRAMTRKSVKIFPHISF